jgi:nitrite reductase/ring-hydroxylating ferredoxin subunit
MESVLGRAGDVAPGQVVAFQLDGRSIAVANVEGSLYGVDDICTHRGCSLSDGRLEHMFIVCPCHGSKFDITDGSVVQGPAEVALKTYSVRVAGDELHVSMPDGVPGANSSELHASTPSGGPPPGDQVRFQQALAAVPLFAGLDPASVESLAAFTFIKSFAPGDVIVEEGRTGNGLYVVLSGNVEVVKGLGTAPRQAAVAVLGPGEPFGEMALLGDWKRSASVRAVDQVECLGMDRWAFLAHLNREPQLAIKMLQMLAARLAETNDRLVE